MPLPDLQYTTLLLHELKSEMKLREDVLSQHFCKIQWVKILREALLYEPFLPQKEASDNDSKTKTSVVKNQRMQFFAFHLSGLIN